MKRVHVSKQNKRSIVLSILEGKYTIEGAALVVHVQPATIRHWLNIFGQEVLVRSITS